MNKRTFAGSTNAHFVTFGCAGRRQLLNTPRSRQIVISVLSKLSDQGQVKGSGFVIMPDHVHALLWFDDDSRLAGTMQTWKRLSSHYLIEYYREVSPSIILHLVTMRNGREIITVWSRRYFDFGLLSPEKAIEKLKYMHDNPVRKGLAERPEDYFWSSAPWYFGGKPVGLKIESGL